MTPRSALRVWVRAHPVVRGKFTVYCPACKRQLRGGVNEWGLYSHGKAMEAAVIHARLCGALRQVIAATLREHENLTRALTELDAELSKLAGDHRREAVAAHVARRKRDQRWEYGVVTGLETARKRLNECADTVNTAKGRT